MHLKRGVPKYDQPHSSEDGMSSSSSSSSSSSKTHMHLKRVHLKTSSLEPWQTNFIFKRNSAHTVRLLRMLLRSSRPQHTLSRLPMLRGWRRWRQWRWRQWRHVCRGAARRSLWSCSRSSWRSRQRRARNLRSGCRRPRSPPSRSQGRRR